MAIRTGLEYPTATPFGVTTTRTGTAAPSNRPIHGGTVTRPENVTLPHSAATLYTARTPMQITVGGDGSGVYPTSGQLWPLHY
ncbi:MAG: hypothetical protein P9F75_00695 [Candidatus Contendobacter sp.]|nr:hypothetical protein [Candidatus Contendobacter sp.]